MQTLPERLRLCFLSRQTQQGEAQQEIARLVGSSGFSRRSTGLASGGSHRPPAAMANLEMISRRMM
jgi:hypothetical protein